MKAVKLFFIFSSMVLLTACGSLLSDQSHKTTVSSSLMDFLYPDKNSRTEHTAEIPRLQLPVNVGLAFVPSRHWQYGGINHSEQMKLLEKVKNSFTQYEFIGRIELIPSSYLAGGQGFSTLEQVSRLHDIEVIALISYDQVTQTLDNNASLLYWTIAGMYLIPGSENSTQTFVDTAVFDIKSRKMLFRAPGISKQQERSTAVGIDDTRNTLSQQGFELAVADMITNLDAELARFTTRVKEEKVAHVEHRSGYSGSGGSLPVGMLFLLGVAAIFRFKARKTL